MADRKKLLRYNLPGFGLVRVQLFPRAREVFDFLDHYRHVKHLKDVDQLGPIRQVLPGAHHTRYEYLMAQLAIITELCHLRGHLPAGLGLASDRETFGRIEGVEGYPSNGEVLMVLALLGNIGHLPSTFSGERALMKYLRDHKRVRAAFRSGLPGEDRQQFDDCLDANQMYQFNYYIAAFLLHRYRRRRTGDSVSDFCQAILRSFITTDRNDPDQALVALWSLYRSIRRLTYLALDSHYAPVPFSLDLASIFFSLEHFLSDVFVEASVFQDALQRLEGVMRDTVYMGPAQLVNHARVSGEILAELEELEAEPITIGRLWDLLGPNRNVTKHFAAGPPAQERSPDPGPTVQLAYDVDPAFSLQLLPDPLGWEQTARAAVGLRSCRFAADFDPRGSHLKITAALSSEDSPIATKAALRVTKQLLDFDLSVQKVGISLSASTMAQNGLALLYFLLPQLLGPNRRFRLRAMPVVETSPVVGLYGSTRAAGQVATYRNWAEQSGLFLADALNEITCLEQSLRTITYRGALVAFAGSTEVIADKRIVAEFDGLVVLLSRDIFQPTLIVVEAKNTGHGHTEAQAQLRDQFARLSIPDEAFEIARLGTKGAYATVTVGG